jgi:DNA-binding NtrC family response regulator
MQTHDQTPEAPSGREPERWLEDAIGRDPVLGPLLGRLRPLAASDGPALVVGPPGSGRELVARTIHNLSARAAHPFVVLDCGTLSEPLIEAELVGMSGPNGNAPHKVGVFEQAGEGTVYLAEVGELSTRLQETLLRILERHEVVRMNGQRPIPAHARCIASTSVDLRSRIPAGLFREDLHARLAAEVLTLPALRERSEAIATLARHFLAQCCREIPNGVPELTPEAERALASYSWPGNLRELREAMEEAALRASGGRIEPQHLPEEIRGGSRGEPLPSLRDVEMRHIERVLQEARGNQRRASRILGISRWSLSRRLRKYGMHVRGDE